MNARLRRETRRDDERMANTTAVAYRLYDAGQPDWRPLFEKYLRELKLCAETVCP
jgi:hypothetical protein